MPSTRWVLSRWKALAGGFTLGPGLQPYMPEGRYEPSPSLFRIPTHSLTALSLISKIYIPQPSSPSQSPTPLVKPTSHQIIVKILKVLTHVPSLIALFSCFINMIFNNNLKLNINGCMIQCFSNCYLHFPDPLSKKYYPPKSGEFLSTQQTGFF